MLFPGPQPLIPNPLMFVAAGAWLMLCVALELYAASVEEVKSFGSNPGNLRMFKYVPDRLPSSPPLVVALHGCLQYAADYDDETGWLKLADQWGFALLFPEQKGTNNLRRCFNWFNGHGPFWSEPWERGSDIDRDEGESLSISQMIERMKTDYRSERIFITGLSAGGGMTAVMLAVYPEVFAGGAIIAGVPYKCALSRGAALSQCGVDLNSMGSVPMKNLSPAQWGDRVRSATRYSGPWPRLSIWHGSEDRTVNPAAARELLEQWSNVHGIDPTPTLKDSVSGYAHEVYTDVAGMALIETYNITGMGHGVPVDPGPGDAQCGKVGKFVLDANICAAYYIGKFWGLEEP
jgi:poly(hydroxyalkanoate) depolymerase family esterase